MGESVFSYLIRWLCFGVIAGDMLGIQFLGDYA